MVFGGFSLLRHKSSQHVLSLNTLIINGFSKFLQVIHEMMMKNLLRNSINLLIKAPITHN